MLTPRGSAGVSRHAVDERELLILTTRTRVSELRAEPRTVSAAVSPSAYAV